MTIAPYLREIGRRKDGARSLSESQAFDLMSRLLGGQISDLEIGAFVLAMRIKGESLDELVGFMQAVQTHCLPIRTSLPAVLLPSYNGARRLPNLTPLLARLLARRGLAVLVHGPLHEAGRVGSAALFEAMAMGPCRSEAQVHDVWSHGEPAFIDIEALCAPLARLLAVREVVGLRNSGHTLAKLLAPLHGAPSLRVANYTHPEYAALMAQFMAHCGADAMLLRGTEGEPVSDARRSPKLQVFVAGALRDDLGCEATSGVLGALPDWPQEHDTASTATYIAEVLEGRKAVPPPIATQVDAVVRALAACARPAEAAGSAASSASGGGA